MRTPFPEPQPAVRARWAAPTPDERAEARLVQQLGIHALTARLLCNRNLSDPAQAEAFLNPDLSRLHDPFLLPDMDKAARRIKEALANGETIFVHGDYDVDGVTSTALYVRALKSLGAKLVYKVPHRKNDGYDLKIKAIDWAHEQGAMLAITSDCGIQAREAVAHANSLGMTVIITDHHEPGAELPPAYAIVNPHRHDSKYPFPSIAGVGVAFKTMQAVTRLVQPLAEGKFIQAFLDLVACGTIADVMPLQDENRIFASFGLELLRKTRKVGLRALLDGASINISKPLSSDAVAFGIGPRINAVGRLDDASIALDLMLTGDAEEARELVDTLNRLNGERQQEQKRIFEEARAQVQSRDLADIRVLVLAAPGWNSGVVGIVASKIVEAFYRPAIVIGVNEAETHGKGSARSIAGFDMFQAIQTCKHLLDSCGGHAGAAGLSLTMENYGAFDELINAHAAKVLTDDDLVPRVDHDGLIEPGDLDIKLLEEWQARLAPFGHSNPAPSFHSRLRIAEAMRMGKDQSHLKLRLLTRGPDGIEAVFWGQGDWADRAGSGDALEAVYAPEINEWNGQRRLQLKIKDLRTQS